MGGNIIPMFVDRGTAAVYDFADNEVPGATDRGTRGTGATSGRWTRTTTRTWT